MEKATQPIPKGCRTVTPYLIINNAANYAGVNLSIDCDDNNCDIFLSVSRLPMD